MPIIILVVGFFVVYLVYQALGMGALFVVILVLAILLVIAFLMLKE